MISHLSCTKVQFCHLTIFFSTIDREQLNQSVKNVGNCLFHVLMLLSLKIGNSVISRKNFQEVPEPPENIHECKRLHIACHSLHFFMFCELVEGNTKRNHWSMRFNNLFDTRSSSFKVWKFLGLYPRDRVKESQNSLHFWGRRGKTSLRLDDCDLTKSIRLPCFWRFLFLSSSMRLVLDCGILYLQVVPGGL